MTSLRRFSRVSGDTTLLQRAALAWVALAFAGQVGAATISGTVFEDLNYGGGAGRTLAASGGQPRVERARVELYRHAAGRSVASDHECNGFSITLHVHAATAAAHSVRVVNGTVRSDARRRGCTTCVAVQTYRTDAPAGTAVAVHQRGRRRATRRAERCELPPTTARCNRCRRQRSRQHWSIRQRAASTIDGVDFGFNFDTIVNTRDATSCAPTGTNSTFFPCQGSLRQFIINANALGGEGSLTQAGSGQLDGVDRRRCRPASSPASS